MSCEMHNNLYQYIDEYLKSRQKAGLLRQLTPCNVRSSAKDLYLNLNDYLQLSTHPCIVQAAQKAIDVWGTSSGGSPVVSSYWHIHQELEDILKKWCGFEHGLLWNSGYTANKALMSALPQKGDIVLVARVDNNELFGNLLVKKVVPWGKPTVANDTFFTKRSLWATRDKAPIWLIVMAYSIIAAVWAVLIYLVIQLFKIRKLGRNASST